MSDVLGAVRRMIFNFEIETGQKPSSIALSFEMYCNLEVAVLARTAFPMPKWEPGLMVDGVRIFYE